MNELNEKKTGNTTINEVDYNTVVLELIVLSYT